VFTEEKIYFECNNMQCSEVEEKPFDLLCTGDFSAIKEQAVWMYRRIFQTPQGE